MAVTSEQKVTSQELSKKLKAAGAVQESEHWWLKHTMEPGYWLAHKPAKPNSWPDCVAAFDCAELLERLPEDIRAADGKVYSWQFTRVYGDYDAYYARWEDGEERLKTCGADTPAEALGKLYLWCLENGHVK